MKTVDKEFIPPATADYTPFATKIKGADANWGYAYAPWPAEAKTFEALRRLGWGGEYLAYGHIQAEDELKRIADPGLEVLTANAMFRDDLPIQKEIREVAAAAGKYSYPATYGPKAGYRTHPRAGADQGRLARQRREGHRRRWTRSTSTPRASAAGRWSGPRKIISAPCSTIDSIATIRTKGVVRVCAIGSQVNVVD